MNKIAKREFEINTEEGVSIIVCTVPLCRDCVKCVNDEWSKITEKYPFVKIYEYDISTDFDKCEQYKVLHTPAILIFKKGKLFDSFIYSNIDEVITKLNIQKSDMPEVFTY